MEKIGLTRREMWNEFLVAGEWGLKEQFKILSDEDIKHMTPDQCIYKCYCLLMNL